MPFGAEELRNPFWQPGEDHIASSYDCVSKLGKRGFIGCRKRCSEENWNYQHRGYLRTAGGETTT
ncbi:hypothetical protein H633G_11440 [Metarhizium anisopliae BRIP 53284]|nr:hypothetical protein H633G_11440 [Metarhizium anisopliae BRIP 53284]